MKMNGIVVWVLYAFAFSASYGCEEKEVILKENLKVASWNVQRLGPTKVSTSGVIDVFIQIMKEYDIIVLEEVTDSSGDAQRELLAALNGAIEEETKKFSMVESARIGSTDYKEQYVFYYRNQYVRVIGTFQYPDEIDAFKYEPFVVLFETLTVTTEKFFVVPIHTSPGDAPDEIDALVDVYDAAATWFNVKDAIILGDFNAGCTYVKESHWEDIRLRNDLRFLWLITDHIDTTTKGTSCPYDRIVIAGDSLQNSVYHGSAKPYYFDETLSITDKEFLYDVSDHYPVEVSIRGKHNVNLELKLGLSTEVVATKSAIEALKEDPNAVDIKVYFEQYNYLEQDTSQKEILFVEYEKETLTSITSKLDSLSSKHPCIFTNEVVSAFKYKIDKEIFTDATLYGTPPLSSTVELSVLCLPTLKCTISLDSPTTIN